MNNENLFQEALKAYYRESEKQMRSLGYSKNEYSISQPCAGDTVVTWKYVYLNNINGQLAKYNHRSKVIIWPN